MKRGRISLGRRVALKILPFAGLLDPRRMQRFQNEVRAAASLEHPHIVPVYAVGSDRGVYYYAMRFIDGPNLAKIIEQLRDRIVPAPVRRARARANSDDARIGRNDSRQVLGRRQRRRLVVRRPRSDDGRPQSANGSSRLPPLVAATPPVGNDEIGSFWGAALRQDAGTRLDAEHIRKVVRLAIEAARASTTPMSGALFIGTSNPPT